MHKERETYAPTKGVNNEGYDFEIAMVAFYSLHLYHEPEIADFKIAINDTNYQPFDDIVLDITTPNQTLQKYTLQLKHLEDKQVLNSNHFTKNGKVFLGKYFKFDFAKSEHVLILTNGIVEEEITTNEYTISVKTTVLGEVEKCLDTSSDSSDHIYEITNGSNKRMSFFTSQKGRVDVEDATRNKLQKQFSLDERKAKDAFQKFRHFFQLWRKGAFGWCKLDRQDIKLKLAEILLWDCIVEFIPHFDDHNPKRELLKDVVNDVKVTIVKDMPLELLNKLCTCPLDFNVDAAANNLLVQDEKKKMSLVLWRLKRFPLVVRIVDVQLVVQQIQQLQDENLTFLLVGDISSAHLTTDNVFENLEDLKRSRFYHEVVTNLKLSIQAQEAVSLQTIVDHNPYFSTIPTLKELLLMVDDDFVVGDHAILPTPYIERRLLTSIVTLDTITLLPKDLFAVCGMTKTMQMSLPNFKYFNTQEFVDRMEREHPFPPKSVIICDNTDFFPKCLNYQHCNVHCVQVIDHKHLRVIRSKNGAQLTKFQEFEPEKLYEVESSGVNLVCGRRGVGKSTVVTHLRQNCPSGYWTMDSLELDPDHSEFATKVRDSFAKSKRLIYFFTIDHLISDMDRIKSLSKDYKVWIFAEDYLREKLETAFGVTAMTIVELSEQDQEDYIRTRLKNHQNQVLPNFKMLKNDIVGGAPMYLFMLTEVFINNPATNFDGIFLLTDILSQIMTLKYGHKRCCAPNQITQDGIYYRNEQYKAAAVGYPRLKSVKCDDYFLKQIESRGDAIGVISQVTSDGRAVFSEQIYADYFAALWCASNYKTDPSVKKLLCEDGSKRTLFMFDLEMCRSNPAHVAVLYGNGEELMRHKNRLQDLDELARTPLHLACGLRQRHEPISTSTEFTYKPLQADEANINQIITFLLEQQTWDPFKEDIVFHRNVVDCASNGSNLYALNAILGMYPTTSDQIALKLRGMDQLSLCYHCVNFQYLNLLELMTPIDNFRTNLTVEDCNGENLLYLAIKTDSESLVEFLLKQGVPPDTVSRKHNKLTPLHLAALNNNHKIVDVLLNYGAAPDVMNRYRNTPLHLAITRGNYKAVVSLLDGGADVNFQNNFGWTPLHYATMNESLEILELLVERGAVVHRRNKFGHQAIDYAAQNSGFARFLSSCGGKRQGRKTDASYYTSYPLHWVAFTGQKDKVESLLVEGWEIDKVTALERTALHVAVIYNHLDLVQVLIGHGASVNIPDTNSVTPLCRAITNCNVSMVELLLKNAANVDCTDSFGYTPLHWATMSGNKDIVRLLLDKNAAVGARDGFGRRPLDCAVEFGFTSIVPLFECTVQEIEDAELRSEFLRWLRGHYENKNFVMSCLHMAAASGDRIRLLKLIQQNRDLDGRDSVGMTALDWACRKGHEQCVRILLSYGAAASIAQEEVLDLATKQHQFVSIFSSTHISICQ